MIEKGKLLCDTCNNQILIDQPSTRVLIDFVTGGIDRHYCENCFREMDGIAEPSPKPPQAFTIPRFAKRK